MVKSCLIFLNLLKMQEWHQRVTGVSTCHQSLKQSIQTSISSSNMHARIVTAFFFNRLLSWLAFWVCRLLSCQSGSVCEALALSVCFVHCLTSFWMICVLSCLPERLHRANQITEDYCQSALCRRGLIYIGKTRQGKRAIIENGFKRDPSWIKESALHNLALLCFVQVPGYEDCTDLEGVEGPGRTLWISKWER